MEFFWGNTANPAGATRFISLNASTDEVQIAQNTTVNGNLNISDFMKLNPKVVPPACAAGGIDNGKVYFSALKKLRVCVDGTWENLH